MLSGAADGLTFLQGYGLTESAPGALFLRATDGTEVQPGEPGEILIHGPNVMTGYWNKPNETAAVLTDDGWLHTGDLAIRDTDGYIYLRDRIKDMIISGGENISPTEVEDALSQHPAIADCAVIGVPDPRWGEVGRAIIVLHKDSTTDPAELLNYLHGKIANYKIPKSVIFTTTLPRTASGKILKKQLRATYGSGSAVDPPGTPGQRQ